MDAIGFDCVTRAVSRALPRRAIAGALGLAVTTFPGHAFARKKRKKCKKRRCPPTTCAGNCPSNCTFCAIRPGGAPTACYSGGNVFCTEPCSSDADCVSTMGRVCITQSAFSNTAEFSDVCATPGGACAALFACT